MTIGSCDCCDRQNVPVTSGDVTACFICQGEDDPDPYGELEDPCEYCNGSGEIACSTRTGRYRCAGPVPDDARGVFAGTCYECNARFR
jgi:hypothetical protein